MRTTVELTVQRAVAPGVWPVVAERHRTGQLLPVRSEGELRLPAEPASANPQTYGETLGRALFSGPIRDAYVAARGDAPVRVWLCVEDPALRTWRWEWLCGPVDSIGWDFLSLDQRALYSLYLPSLTDRPYPPIGRRDLRALVLVANPSDPDGRYGLTAFDATAAVTRLRAVFHGRVSCDVLGRVPEAVNPPTLDGLVTQLTNGAAEGPYSILHVVCHGRFDRETEETWVYLEQPAADPTGAVLAQPVAATTLIERLKRVRQLPHLMFLSVCESSAPEAEQRLGGLAQRLVRELGIPAVIGMTEPVTVDTAHALSDGFYTRLLQPQDEEIGAVDCALVKAYAGLTSRLDVHVPTLYSRLGDQPVFSPAVDRELTGGEVRAGVEQLDALLAKRAPVLRPDVAKHRHALEPWLATAPQALSSTARQTRQASLQAITEICQEALDISFHALVDGTPVPAYDARQPFQGLSPFRYDNREFFFGRDALVETLLRKLTEDRFLPVLGPSGSGKSSVVLAGLVRRLRRLQSDLQVAYLTPGGTPLEQLHAIQATLGDGPVLYVVDQFEEVFTACRDESQRRGFIEAVLGLTAAHRVALTMRADFWGECAPYPELRARMQARQELIAPMTTAELRSAMEQQAAKVGLRFEADLSHTMLDEVAGEPGAMPLLQHTLLELWKRRHGRWLRAAEYRAIGGVKSAIAETAERLHAELPPAEQSRMRNIFLRLTQLDDRITPGEERRHSRRRMPLTELVPSVGDPDATKVLVTRLADAVLVTTSHNPVNKANEVEVAHEALIRHWVRLRNWIDDSYESLRVQNSLADAASAWAKASQDDSLIVHRGPRLESALLLLNHHDATIPLTALEARYLHACTDLRDRLVNERVQRARWAKLAIASIALLLLSVLLLNVWRSIESERHERTKRESRARLLTTQAEQVLQGQRHLKTLSTLLAAQAAKLHPSLETDATLRRTLASVGRRHNVSLDNETFTMLSASVDGDIFVASDGHRYQVWKNGALERTTQQDVTQISLSSTGTILARALFSDVHVERTLTGERINSFTFPSSVKGIAISPNETVIAVYGERFVEVRGIADDKPVRRLQVASEVESIGVDNGMSVTVGLSDAVEKWTMADVTRNKPAWRYDIATHKEVSPRQLIYPQFAVSPDGRWAVLLLSGKARGLVVLDTASGDEAYRLDSPAKMKSATGFGRVMFSADGSVLLTETAKRPTLVDDMSGDDINAFNDTTENTFQLWDIRAKTELSSFVVEKPKSVTTVAVGTSSAVVALKQGLRRWDLSARPAYSVVKDRDDEPLQIALDARGERLALTTSTAVTVIEVKSNRVVSEFLLPTNSAGSSGQAIALSRDGNLVAVRKGPVVTVVTVGESKRVSREIVGAGRIAFVDAGEMLAVTVEANILLLDTSAGRTIDVVPLVAQSLPCISPRTSFVGAINAYGLAVWAKHVRTVTVLEADRASVACAFSEDGSRLAGGTPLGVSIWRLPSFSKGTSFWRLRQSRVEAIAFSSDAKYLSAIDGEGVDVWSVAEGNQIAEIMPSGRGPIALRALSRDGRVAAIYIKGVGVELHKLLPEDLIAEACSLVSRDMITAAWQSYQAGEVFSETCVHSR